MNNFEITRRYIQNEKTDMKKLVRLASCLLQVTSEYGLQALRKGNEGVLDELSKQVCILVDDMAEVANNIREGTKG